ncbi:ATP-binding Cassette (ABC) Superfamily [Thraustotheca clavata]|uniref:ATP-binding Cassette (ABC) Superfamily n=1 Tax=Thraustotheca clavata TaxID=74557 RepID=A0A1V9YN95_9STRA|nr:ATP-binding Cassette (ABC) Superfamily [Thraustotheca clavata]
MENQPLLSKNHPDGLGDRSPEDMGGCYSSLFFSWLTPLLNLGNQRPLEFSDLYQLNKIDRANHISNAFQKYWAFELKNEKPRLWRAMAKAFGWPFAYAGFLKLIHDSLQFVGPIVIKLIITFLSNPDADLRIGLLYALAIFVSGVVQSFALRQYFFYCFETGLRLRSAVVTAVYQKSLVLSAGAKSKKSTGEITNLMSIDAQRLQDITSYSHAIWYAFFQIIVASYLLYLQLGVAFVAGVIVILLLIPTTALISKLMQTLQDKLMKIKDERVKVTYEVLSGIKVIKLQAWENSFTSRVMEFRTQELNRLRKYIYADSFSDIVYNGVPSLVTIASFATYIWLGNSLDVGTALTSLALFNILRFPLFMLPSVINSLVEAQVSFGRLTEFFLMEEREPVTPGSLEEIGIEMKNANFTYSDTNNDTELALRDASLSLRCGQLVAVVGAVGSGKSTLVSGILGDARCASGSVHLKGSVAYVSQQPFILNATLRDNITFGLPFEHDKYEEAIRVSCLKADLAILPGGDLTEIGEKGINLSGGQRTRVAIARAVYQDADIYILDDPLAAVDSHVGSDIFKQCIKNCLKDKLVVLVTNGLNFLKDCDFVIVLSNGSIYEQGTFSDLANKKNGALTILLESVQEAPEEDEEVKSPTLTEEEVVVQKRRASSARSDGDDDNKDAQGNLILDEDRATGDVPWSIYKVWINACGGFGVAMAIMGMFILSQIVNLSATFWLSYWSEQAAESDQFFYLWIFTALNVGYTISVFVRVMTLYLSGLRGSKIIFRQLLTQVLRAPSSFFDTTPLGRIVNRLSKDVYAIDETIPQTWGMLFGTIFSVFTTLCTVVYVTPWFATILIPLCMMYYISQRFFVKTSRELQRLDSISRSPIYALFTETLEGIATIRAFGVEQQFAERNQTLLDRNQRAYFLNFSANCWLALRLEFAGTVVATAAALFAVCGHEANNSIAFAGMAGVSLSYAFNVTQSLNWSVRMISTIQTQMVSVERIHNYCIMDTEAELNAPVETQAKLQALEWPAQGQVTFDQVDLRYRSGLPRVLRKLSFAVEPMEKIGVVGRTGAGKSSLVVAFMRLVEISSGRILLDGIDIGTIGLHDLREKISIIPQDPVLFSGTIRSNLDPFNRYDDNALWTAVKRAHLTNSVDSLDDKVDERGQNFSVGERQLICIARALLKKSRVILMDEATASIDPATDRLIQQSIREEFVNCTTLTIAHRINTILDCDRILVMDKGSVAEFDAPSELLKNANGLFKNLVDHWRDSEDN